MARKSPKDSAKQRGQVKAAIDESTDEILRRVKKEALEGIRRLGGKKNGPAAPSELWPGESMDLGGFTLAKGKKIPKQKGQIDAA